MKKSSEFILKIIIIFGYLLWAFIVCLWILYYNSWKLREQLISITPVFLAINFYLIIFAIILNFKTIKGIFANLPRSMLVTIIVIALAGAFMSGLIPPRIHRIYYDETIYEHIAQNIAYLNKAQMCNYGDIDYGEFHCYRGEHNKEPNGYTFLLSVAYRIFGCKEIVSYLMNNLIYGLAILTIFFIASILFKSYAAGIYSSLIFCFIPMNLIWSNTTSAELCSSCFAGLAFLMMLLFIKNTKPGVFFLAMIMLSFAIQFRAESFLIIIVVFLSLLLFKKEILKEQKYYLITILFLILIIPHLIHFYAVSGEPWGADGSKFSLQFLSYNLRANSFFYIKDARFPLLFSILFIIGIFVNKKWREKSVLLLWFISFWGIFLLFHAGSYNYGADVRFSLVSYMPLAILAGFGLSYLEGIASKLTKQSYIRPSIILILLITLMSFLPYIRTVGQEAWGARADCYYAQEMAELLPVNSLILTHNPNMFLLWGKNSAQASLATYDKSTLDNLFDRYTGGIYFHYNFWCNVDDKVQNEFCQNILDNFQTKIIREYREKNYRFVLYKLEKIK